MICDLCKGKGWVQGQAPDIPTACSACGGKGFVEQTNEEWFDTLTTKGKAEIIAQLSSYGGNVESILLWLKQPHEKE